jgi:hypothetical protein
MFANKEQIVKFAVSRVQKSTQDYIQVFFHSRSLYSGGPIARQILQHPDTISLVANTVPEDGIKKAWQLLGEPSAEQKKKAEKVGGIYDNSLKIVKLLEECASLNIPKKFAAGLMLLHLELCEGYTGQSTEY